MVSGTRDNPPPWDNITEPLWEISPLLTFARPGYIFDKMVEDKEKIAVNIPVIACARTLCLSCLILGGWDKVFSWEKVVPPFRVTLLTEVRQLAPFPSPPPPPRIVSPTRDGRLDRFKK